MGNVISLEQRRSARLAMSQDRPSRLKVSFFFDLASPFTYLAAERVDRLFPGLAWRPALTEALYAGDPLSADVEREAAQRSAEDRATQLHMPLVWPDGYPAGARVAMRVASLAAAQGGHAAPFVLAAVVAAPAAADVGPGDALLGNGRHLQPFGRMTTVGQFPTGGALTRDGRFYWAVGTGRGVNDIRIVSVATGKVVQTLRLPGASGGIVMDRKRSLAYVAGVHDSAYADQRTPDGTPGRNGDVVHVYSYAADGHASFVKVIAVPPQSGAPTPQSFPPTNTAKIAWPDRLAISPDGSMLLVPLNLADSAAIVDPASGAVRYVDAGHYPY